jgi:ribokinase
MVTGYITIIGSLNMDLVVQACRVPLAGETLAGSEFNMIPGGKGANQAVAARRSGAATRMVGCVGQDAFGQVLLDSLSQAGVNVEGIHRLADVSTGIANIVVEETGDNRIIIVPGANGRVTTAMLFAEWEQIAGSSMVILQHEIPLATNHAVIKRCQSEGIPIILNPAPFYPIPEEVLSTVDVLILNETETAALAGMPVDGVQAARQAAQVLYKNENQTIIVTLGKAGAVLLNHDGLIHQPAFRVKAVDTTAAGDTFVGSFAASKLAGTSAAEALVYAAAASAMAVTRLGAQASIPTRDEVENFIKSYENPVPSDAFIKGS